ncbi:Metallo-hydrolase/oxidoreductase [Pseudohyphozyma bogoriensis]|nr:Metallo-hydrolase/oxidoreductase [Pseudohyphozyma bogoriensis]
MVSVAANYIDAACRPAQPTSVIHPALANVALLDLGTLEADDTHFLRGANMSTVSNPNPTNTRRRLAMYSVLIEHPVEGLILWETGAGPGTGGEDDYCNKWGKEVCDIFARVEPDSAQELPTAIAKTGHDIKDVKHVIMGHLHIDHAGGLVHFKGRTDVTIWVHEIELKHAFWGIATKAEQGSYLEHYLDLSLNWRTVKDKEVDLFSGISVYHSPGHTPGLMGMQVNLTKDGPFIFTSDHFHIKENYLEGRMQGYLARDAEGWYNSTEWIRRRHRATNARLIFGHDYEICHELYKEKEFFE